MDTDPSHISEAMMGINTNVQAIQNSKLFQKFMQQEAHQQPTKPKILSQKKFAPLIEQHSSTPPQQANFNPTFEPSYIPERQDFVERVEQPERREVKQWKTPERIDDSSMYHDFQEIKRYQPNRPESVPMQQPTVQQQYRPVLDDIVVQAPSILQPSSQVDRLQNMITDLRKKALDDSHQFQYQILNLNDQIATLSEKIYQLQKSEDMLQMENDRLRQRITQENLLRTKLDEEQKETSLKNFELVDKLGSVEAQIQRQREELIHTRALTDQYKSDAMMYKQQLSMQQERNAYLESQVRTEIQRKEMIQSQLLESQERLHRSQIDQESMRSEVMEQRRLSSVFYLIILTDQEAHIEVEALRKQIQEQRSSSLDYGRQSGYLQQQLFQANNQIESLKTQLLQMEQNQMRNKPLQVHDYYPTSGMNMPIKNEEIQKMKTSDSNQMRDQQDQSFDRYQKYQQTMGKQAQQGGQSYFKERDMLADQNEKDIKYVEQQLLNAQLVRTQTADELKKLESNKVRTGANIRKKVELEQQLAQNEQSIVSLRTKLREMNALFN